MCVYTCLEAIFNFLKRKLGEDQLTTAWLECCNYALEMFAIVSKLKLHVGICRNCLKWSWVGSQNWLCFWHFKIFFFNFWFIYFILSLHLTFSLKDIFQKSIPVYILRLRLTFQLKNILRHTQRNRCDWNIKPFKVLYFKVKKLILNCYC